jgi:hypothetical protein
VTAPTSPQRFEIRFPGDPPEMPMEKFQALLYQIECGRARITLNRPEIRDERGFLIGD